MTDSPAHGRVNPAGEHGRGPSSPVRVLHVDDEAEFSEIVDRFLGRTDQSIEVVTAERTEAALDLLAEREIDCVVSDYDMPDMNGTEFLEAVRVEYPDLPFILFTGKGSEEIASEAISRGVTDYLQKDVGTDQFELLANRIVNAVSRYHAERGLAARATQQSVIAELGQRALESLDLDGLLEYAVTAVADTLGVDHVKILERSAGGESLTLRAAVGWPDAEADETTIETDSQAGYTLRSGEPIVVEDFDTETRFAEPGILPHRGITSGVSTLIGPADDPWGVLGAHSAAPRSFTEDEVTFVQSAANVLAEAVRRHDIEAQLREGEERFRRMAEASPDVIFRTTRDGFFTYVSPVVEDVLGYDRDALEGEHFGRIVPDSSMEAAMEGFAVVVDGDPVEGLRVEIERADDGTAWMEINAVPLTSDGAVDEVLGFTRDVTDEMDQQRDLEEREKKFRAVFEAALAPMLLADDDGTYVDANPAACELFGLDRESLIGRSIDEFAPQDYDFEEAWNAFQTHGAGRGTFPLVLEDGTRRTVEHASTRDVVPGLHLAILRDVTADGSE